MATQNCSHQHDSEPSRQPCAPRDSGHWRRWAILPAFCLLLTLSLISLPRQALPDDRPSVELYVTNWCPYCAKALRFFEDRNISVRVYNIERDPLAAERKLQLDPRRGVPLAVINGQVIYGFAPKSYATALEE